MKIRIKGNTVRYRLSKTEVATLAQTGELEERTHFTDSTLAYSIRSYHQDILSATFLKNTITLYVPKAVLNNWANSNQTGIDYTQLLPDGETLYLLLEKDFKCIDAEVIEDQSDYFENPHLTC